MNFLSFRNAVSALTHNRLSYEDTAITWDDGSVSRLSEIGEVTATLDAGIAAASAEFDGWHITVTASLEDDGICSLSGICRPPHNPTRKIRRMETFRFSAACPQSACVLHQSFLNEGIHTLSELLPTENSRFISEGALSFYENDRVDDAVTFTAEFGAKFYSEAAVEQKNGTVSVGLATVIPYTYEGTVIPQKWTLFTGMPPADALQNTADADASSAPFEAPVGWSTWDYYFTSATEDDVKEQTDFIAGDPVLSKKVTYIALDDGWQQREGDWQSGCRYPSGLKSLVSYIESRGFRAGIWIAPTRLHNLCGTVMRRHTFLIRDEYGDPARDEDMFMLDPTHPEGEAFLRETFRYLGDCGFTFYKLDFISNVFKMDRFYDKTAGPFDALARLFTIVRETVPAGSHIMGCSLPALMGAGWVDSRRSGLDIHNTYKHLLQCTSGYLPQFAASGTVYRLDLDYLVVRGDETADDTQHNVLHPAMGKYLANPTAKFRWRDGTDFSYNEAKMWCGVELMAGSSLFLGDHLTRLNEKGLDLVRRTVENADFIAATPVLDGTPALPSIWLCKKTGRIYLFNFGEESRSFSVAAPHAAYRDLFTDGIYPSENRSLSITLPPHDCLCLAPIL